MQQRADGVWEFAPHNLVDYSEQTHLWTAGGGAVSTPNAALSPNNQLTASKLAVGTSTFPQLTNIETQPVNLAYTASGYFKAAGVNFVQLRLRDSTNSTNFFRALMDLNTGEVGNIIASGVGSVFRAYSEYAGNGWWRLVVSGIPHVGSASTTLQPVVILQTSMAGTVATPSNSLATDGIFIWGMQINRGSFATSYVPTTATTAAYAPAIDWLPTQRVYGLRSEEARTNSIRNNTMVGAVAGTPGTFPTNWTNSGSTNSLTRQIVRTGTDPITGLPYVDLRLSGTPSGTGSIGVAFDAVTAVAAAVGQTWTRSLYLAIVGGNTTNVTAFNNYLIVYDSGSVALVANSSNIFSSVTGTMARFSAGYTIVSATAAYLQQIILVGYTSGNAIDITLRIAAPQLELGSFATSPILTYGAAATRAVDTLVVPNNNWIGQTAASIAVDYVNYTTATGSLISTDDGSTNNRVITFTNGGTTPAVRVVVGGVDQANMNQASVTAGTLGRLAFGVEQDNFAASINGAAVTTDTSGTVPSGQTTMRIGTNVLGAASLNGHITSFRYDNVRLLDQNLIDLTTG